VIDAPPAKVEAVERGARPVPVAALVHDPEEQGTCRRVVTGLRGAVRLVQLRFEPSITLGRRGAGLREPPTRVEAIGILEQDAPEKVRRVAVAPGVEELPAGSDLRPAAICPG
jgi:hypothetical protein